MKARYFFLLISIISSCCISIIENNEAILFFSVFWLALGGSFIKICFDSDKQEQSFRIFNLFFFTYSIYSYIVFKVYIDNPTLDYFIALDSTKFYGHTLDLLAEFNNLGDMFRAITERFMFSETRGYFYVATFVGYISGFVGHNDYFLQQLAVVFLTALIPAILFNISRIYLNLGASRKVAIAFGFFVYIFAYSATLLRDIHVAFLFAIGYYFFLKERRLSNVFILVFLDWIIWTFRPEHGIFFLGIIGVYVFLMVRDNKKNPIMVICSVALCFALTGVVLWKLDISAMLFSLSNTSTRYTQSTVEGADESGLGILLLKLPPGISEFFRAVFSQLRPFPVYQGFNTSMGIVKYLAFPIVLSGVFWYVSWSFVLTGFLKKNLRKEITLPLLSAFFLAVVLIIGASSGSGDYRRLMCVYPVIFMVSGIFYFKMPKNGRKLVLKRSLALYILLHLLYMFLKF